jgi:HlyD family secretion protein
MKKIYIYIGAGLVLLLAVVLIKNFGNRKKTEVEVEKVMKRTIIETVSANGKIQPEVEVKISSDVSGEIIELYVKEGDMVKKGDLLAKINPDIYESSLDRMNAGLNASKANLENTRARLAQIKANFANVEANFKRQKKLFDQGAISQAEFDNAKAQYETALADIEGAMQSIKASEYSVKSSEASLKEASDNLKRTTIASPVDGKVIKLGVEKGERVVGTTQMTGTELMVIASSNEMEVNVEVNENDIIRVNLNDTSLIEVDAYLNRKFKGIVTEIAHSANTLGVSADQVTNFTVKIRILQDSYKDLNNPFRRGMSATVEIQTQRVANVLSVPISAVTTRTDSIINGKEVIEKGKETVKEEKNKDEKQEVKECVFVLSDGTAKMVLVKSGIQDNDYIEIKEGLKEGDEIIIGPYTTVSKLLKDGMKVEVTDKVFSEGKEKD